MNLLKLKTKLFPKYNPLSKSNIVVLEKGICILLQLFYLVPIMCNIEKNTQIEKSRSNARKALLVASMYASGRGESAS
jgi:hypothetical protein